MRMGLLILIALFLGHTCYGASGQERAPDGRSRLEDPIFGISYSYAKVHYEQMPTSLRHICPNFELGTFWTFARVRKGEKEYFVVMGVRPGQDGDSLGVALVVEGSDCTGEDSTQMLSGFVPSGGYTTGRSSGELPGLGAPEVCDGPAGPCHYILRSAEEEDLLRELVRDALTRGALAWGGTDRFKGEVCKLSVQKDNASTPVVQEELVRFCNH
jgi:hypothetical protein